MVTIPGSTAPSGRISGEVSMPMTETGVGGPGCRCQLHPVTPRHRERLSVIRFHRVPKTWLTRIAGSAAIADVQVRVVC